MHNSGNEASETIKEEFKGFLAAIEQFLSTRKSTESLSQIINQGLNVYLQASDAKAASLFFLNEESLEFEHRSTVPYQNKDLMENYFNKLVESGAIGYALQSGTVVISSADVSGNLEYNSMIAPLIVSWGVLGIAFVIFDVEELNVGLLYQKITSLFSSIYAGAIENAMLIRNLNKSNEFLEQKIAERTMSLAQSKRELDAILESVLTGILVIDAESNKIVRANPLAQELIGESHDNLIGARYYEYLDARESDLLGDTLELQGKSFESELKRAGGERLPIIRSVTFITVGQLRFRIESFNDISEIKKAELALKESNALLEMKVAERTLDLQSLVEQLKEEVAERERAELDARGALEKQIELNDFKTRFVSMVSHEFRTPLTIIRSSAQLTEKFFDKLSRDEKMDYLFRIVNTVDLMKDLIENVLFIGKADSDRSQISPTHINLVKFCESTIKDMQLGMTKRRTINFNHNCAMPTAFTDEKILRHVLVNLLGNAIKYSEEDKPVDLDLTSSDKNATFNVRDYGIGIPESDLDKIFEVFYRAKNVGSIAGTGLGMSVVMRSLQLLNGKISVESKPNEGSTFRFSIPLVGF